MLHRSLASAAILAFAAAASAQFIPYYSFGQSVGSYSPITGGTVLGAVTGVTDALSLDDDSYTVTLPFPFTYNGVAETQVVVQTNGHIAFGSQTGMSYAPLSNTLAAAGYVSAFAGDLEGAYGTTATRTLGSNILTAVAALGPISVGDTIEGTGIPVGTTVTAVAPGTITMSANATTSGTAGAITCYGTWSELRWELVGSSPNQEVVFQWSHFRPWNSTVSQNLNFQIRLHENGEIRCVYGSCSPGTSTSTAVRQVGLRGPTNVFLTDVNNRLSVKGTSDWATSLPGTANTSGQPFNNAAPANVIPSGLTYLWTPPPAGSVVASNTTLGNGCGGQFNSAYQLFANASTASAALQGNSLQLINTGSGYVGTWLPGTAAALFVTPVTPATLAVGDEGQVTVTPSVPLPTPFGAQANLRVSGNAIIGFGNVAQTFTGSPNTWTPTAAGFLNSNLGGFFAWHDYNETEGGDVQSHEVDPDGAGPILPTLYITYNNVESWPGTPTVNPSTLQFQLDLNSGNCTIVWVTVDTNNTSTFGSGHLVGVSAPGASIDPGSINLASGFLTITSPEVPSLALAATNRPVQGVGPQNWDLNATNLPVGIGVDIIGLADPGVTNLALFGLGQPGCQLRATLDITGAFLSGGAHPWSFPIPGGAPALNGIDLFAQTAVLDFAINLANTLTTNGVRGTIGNL